MTSSLLDCLVAEAVARMSTSNDPIHDSAHSERVAEHAKRLAMESGLSPTEAQALMIAAWWHDVSRTITKNPSLLLMPLIDDALSAIMLLWHLLRRRLWGKTPYLAVRLIMGKSLGTGAFIKKILLSKRNQFLADILKDADMLDSFAIERCEKMLTLVDGAVRYEIGYKILCRWFTLIRRIKMKTAAARKYVIELLCKLIAWLKQPRIIAWHISHFGKRWTSRSLLRIERVAATMVRHWRMAT